MHTLHRWLPALALLANACSSPTDPDQAATPDVDAGDANLADGTSAQEPADTSIDVETTHSDAVADIDTYESPDSVSDADTGGFADTETEDVQGGTDAEILPDSEVDASADAAPDASPDAFADADPDAIADADPDTIADAEPDADLEPDVEPDPLAACRDALAPAPGWANALRDIDLAGQIELAQTHVVRPDDPRRAPAPVQQRETLLLFTPDVALDSATPLQLAALDPEGRLVGVLPIAPPFALPSPLEVDGTASPLPPYSELAWSVRVPADWMLEGWTLAIAHVDDTDTRHLFTHRLAGLAAPHVFTVTRTHIVLFGEPEFPAVTRPAIQLARDFYAAVPFASLRVVESLPWRIDEVVVRTADGPRLVQSEAEREAVASDDDHWTILKNQMALRLSLANTGRGLTLTGHDQGDSSPYSFGTSVAMGWFRDAQGQYRDIDDAPWAAGWTGWTAMWAEECGNGFIHEVGHSFTLEHFTEGTAARWGIAAEYPQDGVHTAAHPWGYDSVRHRFRTWYRVDRNGPVYNGDSLVGKHDPMNGGESPFAGSCYPQYTPYQAQRIQNWGTSNPTLRNVDGVAAVVLWNSTTRAWDPVAPASGNERPVAIDVPVATFIGTLAVTDEATRIYPPIFTGYGNVFSMTNPFASGAPSSMNGARYVVSVEYADGTVESGLVNSPVVTDTSLRLFSFNVDLRRDPVEVTLSVADSGYPSIAADDLEIVFARTIDPPATPLPQLVHVGGSDLGNRELRLTERCEPGLNCGTRTSSSFWRVADRIVNFGGDLLPTDTALCSPEDAWTEFRLPVVNGDGESAGLVVHGQRVSRTGTSEFATVLTDGTPWMSVANLEQGLRLWLPWAPNADLVAGQWHHVGVPTLTRVEDATPVGTIPLVVDLEVLGQTSASLNSPFLSAPLQTADSSMYFLARDPTVGPVSRVWWDDGVAGPPRLRVPVIDQTTGAQTYVMVDAWHEENGSLYDLHAGRSAGNRAHRIQLGVSAVGNDHLVAGHTYRSPPSAPLVLEGRRWHAPNAETLVGTFAFVVEFVR